MADKIIIELAFTLEKESFGGKFPDEASSEAIAHHAVRVLCPTAPYEFQIEVCERLAFAVESIRNASIQ